MAGINQLLLVKVISFFGRFAHYLKIRIIIHYLPDGVI